MQASKYEQLSMYVMDTAGTDEMADEHVNAKGVNLSIREAPDMQIRYIFSSTSSGSLARFRS